MREAVRTRDHSELALRAFGATLNRTIDSVSIAGPQLLHAIDAAVPGDISSAAFFLCAAAIFPGSSLVLDASGSTPPAPRCSMSSPLSARTSPCSISKRNTPSWSAPSRSPRRPRGSAPQQISGALAAQLIDELPVLAAIAPYTSGGIRIRDAKELRVKESDRIALVAQNLRAMGAEVTEFEDGLDIPGGQSLHGATIDSGGDHRIAMAFSVAALRAEGETLIQGAESAAISFPEFFDLLDRSPSDNAPLQPPHPPTRKGPALSRAFSSSPQQPTGLPAESSSVHCPSRLAATPGTTGELFTVPVAASFILMP